VREAIPRREPHPCPSAKTLWPEPEGPLGLGPEPIELIKIGLVILEGHINLKTPPMKGSAKKNLAVDDRCDKTLATGHARKTSIHKRQVVRGNLARRELACHRLQRQARLGEKIILGATDHHDIKSLLEIFPLRCADTLAQGQMESSGETCADILQAGTNQSCWPYPSSLLTARWV
jgi:hypothetical protein